MIHDQHSTRYPRLFWQAFGLLFIVTATMGMGDCGKNNPAVSTATSSDGLSASLVQQSYLKASNTGATDEFGVSLALSGDTLVVGAYGGSSNATWVGAIKRTIAQATASWSTSSNNLLLISSAGGPVF
jgi:hypothetical protein